jgi:hypothetical protein
MADMVVLTEAVDPWAIDLEQSESPLDEIKFIEINEQIEYSVEEFMAFWA